MLSIITTGPPLIKNCLMYVSAGSKRAKIRKWNILQHGLNTSESAQMVS